MLCIVELCCDALALKLAEAFNLFMRESAKVLKLHH